MPAHNSLWQEPLKLLTIQPFTKTNDQHDKYMTNVFYQLNPFFEFYNCLILQEAANTLNDKERA